MILRVKIAASQGLPLQQLILLLGAFMEMLNFLHFSAFFCKF